MRLPEILRGFVSECRALARCTGAVLLFISGLVFYSILYPSPYLNELPQKLEFAAVDQDGSLASRVILRLIGTTEGIRLRKASSRGEAAEAMRSGRIAGMMVIPRDFERRLLSGRAQSIPLYCDASHLLLYRSVLTGVQQATGSAAAAVRAAALMRRGVSKAAAASLQTAGRADVRLMYNPCGNYMLNTVPPVFVLIIQQILMAGCGMIEASRRQGGAPEGGLMHMAGRALVPACLGMAFSLYYFWALAYVDDLIRPRDFGAVLLYLMPFFMASAMCGHLIGRFTNSQSLVLTAVLPISVPCLFLTGCIWPAECMGEFFGTLRHLIPATPGINGYLMIAGRGASLSEVLPLWLEEWGQFLLLLGASLLVERRDKLRRARAAADPA